MHCVSTVFQQMLLLLMKTLGICFTSHFMAVLRIQTSAVVGTNSLTCVEKVSTIEQLLLSRREIFSEPISRRTQPNRGGHETNDNNITTCVNVLGAACVKIAICGSLVNVCSCPPPRTFGVYTPPKNFETHVWRPEKEKRCLIKIVSPRRKTRSTPNTANQSERVWYYAHACLRRSRRGADACCGTGDAL